LNGTTRQSISRYNFVVPVWLRASGRSIVQHRQLTRHPFNMEEPLTLPSIHAFPPFFTRQPNAQTYATQKTAWTNLILNYYRSNRLWRIDVNQETIEKIPIFSNKQIQRTPPRGRTRLILGKIKMEFLQELVNGMVENGQAEWVGKNTRVQALLFWYKPEEWANMISNWVNPRRFCVQEIILTFRSMRRDRRIQC
jgi:hypothetical protein